MIEAIDEDNPYSLETAAAFHKFVKNNNNFSIFIKVFQRAVMQII